MSTMTTITTYPFHIHNSHIYFFLIQDTISIRSTDNGTPKRRRQSYSSERSNSNKSDVKVTMLGGKEKKISDTYKNSPSLQSILSMSTGTLKKSASKVLVESIKDLRGQRRLSGEIDNR